MPVPHRSTEPQHRPDALVDFHTAADAKTVHATIRCAPHALSLAITGVIVFAVADDRIENKGDITTIAAVLRESRVVLDGAIRTRSLLNMPIWWTAAFGNKACMLSTMPKARAHDRHEGAPRGESGRAAVGRDVDAARRDAVVARHRR